MLKEGKLVNTKERQERTPTVPILDLYKSARIQEIEEAAIEMEHNGFLIDVSYFNKQAQQAALDYRACLDELKLHVSELNYPTEDADAIWASPKQLVELLHDNPKGFRLPPSPYWFKGRVKID